MPKTGKKAGHENPISWRDVDVISHGDGMARCPWCGVDPLYVAYHDEEWGRPERCSRALFEKLVLDESRQAFPGSPFRAKERRFAPRSPAFGRNKSQGSTNASFPR